MKILLHICCANCAIYPVSVLRDKNHTVDGFFYNNNIHPYQEFKKRLDAVREYSGRVELNVQINETYMLEEFLQNVASDPANRCEYCYQSRMEETARAASEQEYEAFTTTLLYSRYQQNETIKRIGEELAQQYGVKFYMKISAPAGRKVSASQKAWNSIVSNIAAVSIPRWIVTIHAVKIESRLFTSILDIPQSDARQISIFQAGH